MYINITIRIIIKNTTSKKLTYGTQKEWGGGYYQKECYIYSYIHIWVKLQFITSIFQNVKITQNFYNEIKLTDLRRSK